jgi:uncharacterized protein (TIGR02217 family)
MQNQTNINGKFLNIRFFEKFSYGTEFLIESAINISTLKSGNETRTCTQNFAKKKYNILLGKLSEVQVREIFSFFSITKGPLNSFRFKDITNYKVINQGLLKIDELNYQIVQPLRILSYNGLQTVETNKKITKLVDGTIEIFLNSNILDKSKYTINFNDGIITFNQPQNDQDSLNITCEFDIPVRFENQNISLKYTQGGFELSGPINLIEVLDE